MLINIPNLNTLSILMLSLIAVIGCSPQPNVTVANPPSLSLQDRLGTRFYEVNAAHFKAPKVKEISFQIPDDGAAIWGATGRDSEGNIYVGVSTYAKEDRTAYLVQYNPITEKSVLQGDVLSQLKKLNIYRPGMGQSKLHSKFYQAEDGYLYFSSFDEKGETGEINPTWGGHLWRKLPHSIEWEHILSSEDALIAVNTDSRFVYALGYWGHVLYQYDTVTQSINKVTVGSVKGHISRNFLVSQNGHVFVPKVEFSTEKTLIVNLNEYDSALNLVASTPLEHYLYDKKHSKHGIVSYINMKNGDIYFVTAVGALYKISQTNNNRHQVSFEVFLSETDEAGGYFPSLFSLNGENFLGAFGRLPNSKHYSWLVYETSTKTTAIYDLKSLDSKKLLYGSVTRDNLGNLYVVGLDQSNRSKHQPMILQLSYK
jgi:hypothetical protein